MSYIDGFVVPVPTANKDAYIAMAQKAAELFKEFGALDVVEGWGDDVPDGKLTSFAKAVDLKPYETVVFSWVIWPSKEARDEGNRKVMADPRMNPSDPTMPFDGKRVILGGFTPILKV